MLFFTRLALFTFLICGLEVNAGLLDFLNVWDEKSNERESHIVAGLDNRRPIDESSCATEEIKKNSEFSSPVECARTCKSGEKPKTCYYHFTLEYYGIVGPACNVCKPNATINAFCSNCQCVEADGVERGFLSANRMLPGPMIEVCEGDRVLIDVFNNIEGGEVTIHWHGIFQKGSQYYDGAPFITQCPIMEGTTFRYSWLAGNEGTHFWHAHTGLQKLDGVFGGLVVRKPPEEEAISKYYDFDLSEHVILASDWMHDSSTQRFPGQIHKHPGQDPDNFLINGRGRYTNPDTGETTNTSLAVFTVTPGKRSRFRFVNTFCTVCPASLAIQDHSLTVIALDGVPVKPTVVDTIVSFSGERYDFVINANESIASYYIQLKGLGECGEKSMQQLAILRYEGASERPNLAEPHYNGSIPDGLTLNSLSARCDIPEKGALCIDDLQSAIPIDRGLLKLQPDVKIYLPFRFVTYEDKDFFQPNQYKRFLIPPGGNEFISIINGITFNFPTSPPLSQYNDIPSEQFCNGTNKPDHCLGQRECPCTHRIRIPLNSIVEIVLVDEVGVAVLSHPFHLHGYAFSVIGMGRSPDKKIKKMSVKHAVDLDRKGLLNRRFNLPPAKDTLRVPTNGYTVFRFRANNPGFWLFHCHFLYHILIGMDLVLQVGELSDLPPVPKGFPTCHSFKPNMLRSSKHH
ncbi:uncharacterized protein [Prorops nasuta]|uniref:uncharacterized protein n=1 Tax=Prorops nasuta TaxID=863751 RepID=UPI0034CF9E83